MDDIDGELTPTEQVIRASLSSPEPFDVKFFLFSKRQTEARSHGQWTTRVGEPRAVFAASVILQSVDYFRGMLSNGFAESRARVPFDAGFPGDRTPYTEEFGYESDSDLGDDDELSTSLPNVQASIRDDHSSGPLTAVEPQTATKADQKGQNPSFSGSSSGQCRLIFINDIAYRTWRAFVFYLYTKKLNFAPLKSSCVPVDHALAHADNPKGVPSCSPKSMYRLAEKYGLSTLQELAFHVIQEHISARNIVQEVTTKFTSRYKEIQDFEVRYLCNNYTSPEVKNAMPGMIVRLVNGQLPHSGSVITELFSELKPPGSDSTWYFSEPKPSGGGLFEKGLIPALEPPTPKIYPIGSRKRG